MKHYKIHPTKIALVQFSRVQDGTVATLDAIKNDTAAWLFPRRVEDGITLNITGETEDYEGQGSSGVLVPLDSIIKRKGVEFTINLSHWTFSVEQLARGGKTADVATDHTASISANDDATSIEGLGNPTKLETEKFTLLIEMPANKSDSKVLYLLMPKVGITFGDREMSLNHAQQNPSLTFRCYGLETADPDELTPVQSIYTEATDDGLLFPIEGKTDV